MYAAHTHTQYNTHTRWCIYFKDRTHTGKITTCVGRKFEQWLDERLNGPVRLFFLLPLVFQGAAAAPVRQRALQVQRSSCQGPSACGGFFL